MDGDNLMSDQTQSTDRLASLLKSALAQRPATGEPAITKAPGVIDVMGGIGEDSGSLVITSTAGVSFTVALWATAEPNLAVRFCSEGGEATPRDFVLPLDGLLSTAPEAIISDTQNASAEWAAPVLLAIRHAIAHGGFARPAGGFAALVLTDFPPDADLGRHAALSTAVIDAFCRLLAAPHERLEKAALAADAVLALTGIPAQRIALTALAGPADGSLLQIQFHPQPKLDPLPLPPCIAVAAARTFLTRPTTPERLIETRACTAMSQLLIAELQRADGVATPAHRLAAIDPTEYVERFRDRLPSKMTGRAFLEKFGELRGVNGCVVPADTYKVRSRAEHHIYENRRVHDFASLITRAKRTNSSEALAAAGGLMYASHWSYSQRCGIGGVETDRLVSAIRKQGAAVGLFGAKVTGGGHGGEVVVLKRADDTARSALATAVREAQAASNRTIHTFRGALPGAEFFNPAPTAALVGA
ncbi:MAG: hypothetical protein DCC66_09755 [Planctomycetota bacterium]|nr:MAG: hypothetical protein DCC66_09755 [Planctomycetota bacterium]